MRYAPATLSAALTLAAVPFLAACGGGDATSGDGPRVVASFYPLEYVAERVAGEHADVQPLTSPGTEPHDLDLTLQQTAEVSEADLVVVSSGFQPAVDEAVEQNAGGRVVDAAEVADFIPASADAHADAEDWDEEWLEEHGDEPLDPHFWLDPGRLAAVAVEVKRQLVAVDPDHAGAYEKNLTSLKRDLDRLDRDITEGLQSCERDTVVVSHNAFGYFAIHYGLHMRAINGISPDAEPSPAHLRELSGLIESEGITTVFSETLASPKMADTLAEDLGLRTGVLDPIEGLSDETADEDYLSLMRANLAAIQEANGCR